MKPRIYLQPSYTQDKEEEAKLGTSQGSKCVWYTVRSYGAVHDTRGGSNSGIIGKKDVFGGREQEKMEERKDREKPDAASIKPKTKICHELKSLQLRPSEMGK